MKARGPMVRRQGQRQPALPSGEEGLDGGRVELIAQFLEPGRIGAGQEAVVERSKRNPAPGELPLDPLGNGDRNFNPAVLRTKTQARGCGR